MSQKSLIAHYRNKYPDCLVQASSHGLDVYRGDEHVLCLEKNGQGMMVDMSEAYGLPERHDLSPIPVESRAWKLDIDGNIKKHAKHEERKAWSKENHKNGKILSIEEYKELSKKIDDDKK